MTAWNFTLFDVAKPKFFNGTIAPTSHTIKIALLDNSVAFSNTYVGASTNAQWSDVSAHEVSGTGYTSGGITTTVSTSQTGGVCTIADTGLSLSNATVSAVVAVAYDSTTANHDLIGFGYLDPNGAYAPVASINGPLNVTFSSGWFTW